MAAYAAVVLRVLTIAAAVVSAGGTNAAAEAIELTLYRARVTGADDLDDRPTGVDEASYAVVRERRVIRLKPGLNRVRLEPVPSRVAPGSVRLRGAGADGLQVTSIRRAGRGAGPSASGQVTVSLDSGRELSGILAGTGEHHLLLRRDRSLALIPRARVTSIHGGESRAAALIVGIEAERAGDHEVELSYETAGISWDVAYTAVRDGSSIDLSAALEIDNKTGVAYTGAVVHLVDRTVERAVLGRSYGSVDVHPVDRRFAIAAGTVPIPPGSSERPLFAVRNIAAAPVLIYEPRPGRPSALRFPQTACSTYANPPGSTRSESALELSPEAAVMARIAAGSVRLLDRITADELRPVSVGVLEIDRAGGVVRIKTGESRDVSSRRDVTACHLDNARRRLSETVELVVESQASEPVDVLVRVRLERWPNWVIAAESERGRNWERGREYRVGLMPRSSETLRFTGVYAW